MERNITVDTGTGKRDREGTQRRVVETRRGQLLYSLVEGEDRDGMHTGETRGREY